MAAIVVKDPPQLKHRHKWFRDGFLSLAIIGKSGSGKTRVLTDILPHISERIKTLIIATVVHKAPVHEAIVKWFDEKNPPGHRWRDYMRDRAQDGKMKQPEYYAKISHDPEELLEGTEHMIRSGMVSLDRPGLLIVDDFNKSGRATGPYWDFIIHAFTKYRNAGFHFIIIAQQPQALPTVVRQCTTARILFDCASKTAIDTFAKDVLDRVPDRHAFKVLGDYIRRVPYTYILCREHPFDVAVGKGLDTRSVLSERSVSLPTMRQLMSEMGVSSRAELDQKSAEAQAQAGNTSSEVHRKL